MRLRRFPVTSPAKKGPAAVLVAHRFQLLLELGLVVTTDWRGSVDYTIKPRDNIVAVPPTVGIVAKQVRKPLLVEPFAKLPDRCNAEILVVV
jgi:hypothetical protein